MNRLFFNTYRLFHPILMLVLKFDARCYEISAIEDQILACNDFLHMITIYFVV